MIKLNCKKAGFTLNLPTSLEEITPEYLKKCTEHITLANDYAVIALVLTTKLSEYCYTLSNPKGKEPELGVTPVLVKYNSTEKYNFKEGQIVIVSNTDLERGYHCNVPSGISSSRVSSILLNDEELRRDLQLGKIFEDDEKTRRLGDNYVKVIQFKIIPMCDIHGSFTPIKEIKDEFITMD